MPRLSFRVKKIVLKVLYGIVIVGVVALLIMVALILKESNDSADQRLADQGTADDRQQQVLDELKATGDRVEADLACMGTFFSLPDRVHLRITDLQKCDIIDDETGEQSTLDTSQFIGQSVTPGERTSPTGAGTNKQQGSSPPNTNEPDNPPDNTTPQPPGFIEGALDVTEHTIKNVVDFLIP